MFEYTIDRQVEKKSLSKEQEGYVVSDVSNKFSSFDDDRSKQMKIYRTLSPEINLDENRVPEISVDEKNVSYWQFLNATNAEYRTQKAFFWDNLFANFTDSFDVEGKDEISLDNALKQKRNLDNAFYNMDIDPELDQALTDFLKKGEFCLFVSWKKKYRKVRRKLSVMEQLEQNGLASLLRGEKATGIFEEEIYDGAYVTALNPLNVVFDSAVNPDIKEQWDSCAKIVKTWKTYNQIKNNKLFKLSKDALESIKAMTSSNSTQESEDKDEDDLLDDVVNGNKVEVLEYWGDYILNGQNLSNWHIVVIGRKHLAVFEYNKYIENPIINVALERDEKNKRGIPSLYSSYSLNKAVEFKIFLQNLSQALNLNPPRFAPEGMLDSNDVDLYAGKVIEFKKGLENPSDILPITFPLIGNENLIAYFENKAQQNSGVTANMQGATSTGKQTATEAKIEASGSATRTNKDIDTLKQNGIVVMVSKVASLIANNKIGEVEEIVSMVKTDGSVSVAENIQINDVIRQGNYNYKYTDSNGVQKRLLMNQQITQVLTPVWNDPSIGLNKKYAVEQALKSIGVEDTSKYFNQQTPIPTAPANPMMAGGNVPQLPTGGLNG